LWIADFGFWIYNNNKETKDAGIEEFRDSGIKSEQYLQFLNSQFPDFFDFQSKIRNPKSKIQNRKTLTPN
jgi:hypothetical protein